MAGEWIPYDIGTPRKPEVLELVDRTGLENATVVGRLQALWGWAALNSSDGTIRISVRLLAKECGGDEDFWLAVRDVGWLVVNAEEGTVAIPGWERRFSKSAKARAMHGIRAEDARVRTTQCAKAHAPVRGGAPEEIEERRSSSSSPREAAHGQADGPEGPPATWETLQEAWRKGRGRPWKLPEPPDRALDRLAEPGWIVKALAAIQALPQCRYFRDPVTLAQLVAPGFVDKVLGGQFDNPRDHRGVGRPDDRPPPQAWSGEDAARLEATKRAMIAKIKGVVS